MTNEEIHSILERNKRHNQALFAPYNPLTGEGSPIERTKLVLDDTSYFLLPNYMFRSSFLQKAQKYPTAKEYVQSEGLEWKDFLQALFRLRIKWDFEFWAGSCCQIKDKTSGQFVKFVPRKPQLKLLKVLVDDFANRVPIRVILLKARQWGGSTLVQMFLAWIQLFHRENWNSVIVAHQKDPARNIRAMYSNMALKHPPNIQSVRFRNFEGSSSNRQLVNNGSVISIGSMERPEALRSDDIKLAHFSEVGLYRETKGKSPEDLIQAIVSSIPSDEMTAIVMESTAKGIGNYFHQTWIDSEEGRNAYRDVFVAWFEIDIYYKAFYDEQQVIEFVRSLDATELYRFNLGATLEGLNWYREKRRELPNDWRMMCEYPSTPQEAFETSGNYAHNPQYIEQARMFTKPPLYVGELFADAPYGEEAIDESLKFEETVNGSLHLWAMPDTSQNISDRYVVSLDIGGRTDTADWSVVSVIDRYQLMHGGIEECIGTWRFHLDQDLTVWRAVQTAKFFCNALLVVESNSLDYKGTEGDHSLTILDEIRHHYDNLYYRGDPQKIKEGQPAKYGFHTNTASKTDLVNQMNKRFRELLHIEYDKRAIDEAQYYELKPNGTYGAVTGKHDDIYMSRAIGLKASDTLPVPAIIKPQGRTVHKPPRNYVRTEANF